MPKCSTSLRSILRVIEVLNEVGTTSRTWVLCDSPVRLSLRRSCAPGTPGWRMCPHRRFPRWRRPGMRAPICPQSLHDENCQTDAVEFAADADPLQAVGSSFCSGGSTCSMPALFAGRWSLSSLPCNGPESALERRSIANIQRRRSRQPGPQFRSECVQCGGLNIRLITIRQQAAAKGYAVARSRARDKANLLTRATPDSQCADAGRARQRIRACIREP
ncbi:hypothetical protein OKW41_002707 [Paraburkholderia sp. UCT70]